MNSPMAQMLCWAKLQAANSLWPSSCFHVCDAGLQAWTSVFSCHTIWLIIHSVFNNSTPAMNLTLFTTYISYCAQQLIIVLLHLLFIFFFILPFSSLFYLFINLFNWNCLVCVCWSPDFSAHFELICTCLVVYFNKTFLKKKISQITFFTR